MADASAIARQMITAYYAAFNRKAHHAMADLLDADVVHDINQGPAEIGKDAFLAFLEHMAACYDEQVDDLTIFTHGDTCPVAAEFVVSGRYLNTDSGFPHASGQKYLIRCGAFFHIRNDKISRVTTFYNIREWKNQITPLKDEVTLERIQGRDILPYIDALASLRISVFREYPYLYDGSLDYEKEYLAVYARSTRATIILARKGERIMGASTAIPLEDENDYVQEPFVNAGIDLHKVFYFGESVLDRAHRGLGIGYRFFVEREWTALELPEIDTTSFCAVIRPPDHPRKPAPYTSLDTFWLKRGYRKAAHLQSRFSWKEIDEETESPKPMQYWLKSWKRFR